MPKRAVMVSFELWKDWMTQGYQGEGFRCTHGIPENAVLVQTFLNQYSNVVTPDLIAIFESPDFDPAHPKEYAITCPDGSRVPIVDIEFESQRLREHYSIIKWQDGENDRKLSVRALGSISVLFDWRPDKAVGRSPLGEDPDCTNEIPWLC